MTTKHGTLPGFMAHLWEGTAPCAECLIWRAHYPYRLEYRPRHGVSCVGYHWHRFAKVPQCDACREANRLYHQDLNRRNMGEQAGGLS
jgi:hypothetical protein